MVVFYRQEISGCQDVEVADIDPGLSNQQETVELKNEKEVINH